MGPVSIERLALVIPALSANIYALEKLMSCPIGVTQGVRTDAEQAALFAQGRNSLVVVNALRAKVGWASLALDENIKPVTDARPGYSWHPFGMAVDLVPEDQDTGAPDWNEKHPTWQEIVTKGESLGMVSGISWHDTPHLQMTGRFPVTPTDEVRALMQSGGMQAVWQASGIYP